MNNQRDEIETGCKVYQGVKRNCPECGQPLADDGKWLIYCTDCDYREEFEGEPLDIGEIF
jgi:hypothetical protein